MFSREIFWVIKTNKHANVSPLFYIMDIYKEKQIKMKRLGKISLITVICNSPGDMSTNKCVISLVLSIYICALKGVYFFSGFYNLSAILFSSGIIRIIK